MYKIEAYKLRVQHIYYEYFLVHLSVWGEPTEYISQVLIADEIIDISNKYNRITRIYGKYKQ